MKKGSNLKRLFGYAGNYKEAQNLPHYAWMAVLFSVAAILIYVAALMCSNLAAFRVQANILVYESSAATETCLAHQPPYKANALAAPVGLLILLLVFDWRLGLLSLVPVVIAFIIMSVMTGKRMAKRIEEYNNALGQMSNEAAIDNYEKWVSFN